MLLLFITVLLLYIYVVVPSWLLDEGNDRQNGLPSLSGDRMFLCSFKLLTFLDLEDLNLLVQKIMSTSNLLRYEIFSFHPARTWCKRESIREGGKIFILLQWFYFPHGYWGFWFLSICEMKVKSERDAGNYHLIDAVKRLYIFKTT